MWCELQFLQAVYCIIDCLTIVNDVGHPKCLSKDNTVGFTTCNANEHENYLRQMQQEPHPSTESVQHLEQALVVYEPANVILPFHRHAQQFTFAGKKIVLLQEWEKHGVAAVVWEAVRY